MRILLADSLDESAIQALSADGHECVSRPDLTADTLPEAIAGAEVLVVRSTKVLEAAFDAADQLSLIVRAGAGTDNIDLAAASQRGIYVCNVPGRNAIAVAELTMGLLLSIDRRIPDNTADLRAGRWDKKTYTKSDGLHGKQLGIIGLGDIGLATAERAKAFGLSVAAVRKTDRSSQALSAIRSVGVRLIDSLDELLASSDVVSLHVPKAAGTIGMVDADFLAKMRTGSILLNTSRGDIVDAEALLAALDAGKIRAGLDVWPDEPGSSQGEFDSILAKHPAVVGTHHIGASTAQAQRSVASGAVEVISAYAGGQPVNCVNLRLEAEGGCQLSIRHLDRVGVLAEVFAILRSHDLNVQQMENQVFVGGQAAVANINVSQPVTDVAVAELCAVEEVLSVNLDA